MKKFLFEMEEKCQDEDRKNVFLYITFLSCLKQRNRFTYFIKRFFQFQVTFSNSYKNYKMYVEVIRNSP